ncbi:SufE family protein [Pacificimonas sp. WHA3]|uniref:SufE family protein n=1 Tax=Pacificimonas pallii TaxID=2827236 RepID=A0ABS6SE92_9SPHN|nr:SufE family protein [Pacificimonas pallii]MBV7256231.1 SufE family protein [Pacificimonas pallii]
MNDFDRIEEDWEILEPDDRYRLLIDLGKDLEEMPDALKTDATKVRGCSADVWVYPVSAKAGALRFLADSNAAITKGIVALILTLVQDRSAAEVRQIDIAGRLKPFALDKHLSSNRTQGIPNMIALVQETAKRLAA